MGIPERPGERRIGADRGADAGQSLERKDAATLGLDRRREPNTQRRLPANPADASPGGAGEGQSSMSRPADPKIKDMRFEIGRQVGARLVSGQREDRRQAVADPLHDEFQDDIDVAVGGQFKDEMTKLAFRIGRRDGVETGEMNAEIAVQPIESGRYVGRGRVAHRLDRSQSLIDLVRRQGRDDRQHGLCGHPAFSPRDHFPCDRLRRMTLAPWLAKRDASRSATAGDTM